MTLRKKILVITSLTLVGLFAVLVSIARSVWYGSFDALESKHVELDVQRVTAALADEITRLHSVAADWGEWDQSYDFVEDGNEAYAKSNLAVETFARIGVDVIAYVHTSGKITFYSAFDRITGAPLTLPPDFEAALHGDSPLLGPGNIEGILGFSDRVAVVVAHDILPSAVKGNPRGKLIMMRLLDERVVASLAERTHVKLDAFLAGATALPPDVVDARAATLGLAAVQVQTHGETEIAGYTQLRDIKDRPALLLRILEPRDIHLQAGDGFKLLMVALIATGIVFAGLTLFLLERFVLLRLARLSREASDVGSKRDAASRVSVQGSDEPAATASAINAMLDALAQSRSEHEASEAALRASEERLLQGEKMEAIGRLAGGLAHDFNNLLVVMIGHASLLATKLGAGSPLVRHADEIQRAGERSAALTQRLLAFSRKQAVRPVVVDLRALLDQNEDMLRRLVGTDIEFVRAPSGPIDSVLIDPDQMTQVRLNLSANSRDALVGGGHIKLATTVVEFERETDGVPPGRWVRLTFEDDGIGMDETTLRHLFEPFFTTKAPGKGTGLGLASAHGIVHQAGGHIRVSSALGRGTVFRFYLPAVAAPAGPAPREAAGPNAERGSETILLVDDESAVRELACEALSMNGYNVLQAEGPHDALRLARSSTAPIRVLVTDVLMPKMRGPRLAQEVTAARSDIAVLFISGYPDDPDLLTAVAAGGAFLQKPFTPDSLVRSVRELLDASARVPV